MANQISRIRLCIEVDPTTGAATAVTFCKYRVEDSVTNERTGVGDLTVAVGDLDKVANDTGAVGELIRDLFDAAKAQEGL